MDVTPTPPQPRPTRAKSSAVTTVTPAKIAAKSGRRSKGTTLQSHNVPAFLSEGPAEVPADLDQRIATTAYFLAAARNFEPGHELEDWLQAEQQARLPPTP
jgi:hypothetical protein